MQVLDAGSNLGQVQVCCKHLHAKNIPCRASFAFHMTASGVLVV